MTNQFLANTMDQDGFQDTAANEAASAFCGTGTLEAAGAIA
jgi:hypothetical protein